MTAYFQSFKTFVNAKPADEAYDHVDENCALGQWGREEWPTAKTIIPGYCTVIVDDLCVKVFDHSLPEAERLVHAIRKSSTFGELAQKLELVI